MNWRERCKPSNTARLAVRLLQNAQILERGRAADADVPSLVNAVPVVEVGARRDDSSAALERLDPKRCLLLYPSDEALSLAELVHAPAGSTLNTGVQTGVEWPWHLIVPDGTWGQTRRWVRREAWLDQVQRVKLPAGAVSGNYQLRRAAASDLLSTIEATAVALGCLEGADVQAMLIKQFERWQSLALLSRNGGL